VFGSPRVLTAMTFTSTVEMGTCTIAFDERVLTPRPWTLMQSVWAAELSPDLPDGPILELCAGAGQIGLVAAVATGRPLVQVDIDPAACEFARMNAAHAGIAERVVVRCEPLEGVTTSNERYPLILADPPYLPSEQVRQWPNDPTRAIDGGPDGLELIRGCLAVKQSALAAGGIGLLQIAGSGQVDQLIAELPDDLAVREVRQFDSVRAVALIGHRPRARR